MNAIELIEQQQKKLEQNSAAWVVGEQLKDICRSEPASAALLENDLDKKGMGIADAERQVRVYADTHRKGNFAFVSPKVADGILREFYGLPAADAAPQPEPEPIGGSGIVLIVVLAIVVEALVEYGKSLIEGFKTGGWKAPVVQLVAMAVAVLLCFAANADLFTVLGVEFSAPWICTLLTGIFASRGSNYISDLIGKLQAGKVPDAAPDGDEG